MKNERFNEKIESRILCFLKSAIMSKRRITKRFIKECINIAVRERIGLLIKKG